MSLRTVGVLAALLAGIAIVLWRGISGPLLAGTILVVLILIVWTGMRQEEAERDSTVWNLIPGEQYTGRHARSGGLTREEQEAVIREIKRRADEIDEHERGR